MRERSDPLLVDTGGGHPSTVTAGRRSIGVTGRLVALVMIPLTVMCGLAVAEVVAREATAAALVGIDRGVVQLSALVELHGAMASEQAVDAFGVRVAQVGVTEAAASAVLGVDIPSVLAAARTRADHAVAALGASSPISNAAIVALHASVDGGVLTQADAEARFAQIDHTLAPAISVGVGALESRARPTHADSLVAALESLRVADSFVDIATPQGSNLSVLWYPATGTTPKTTLAVMANLSVESANYASASQRIHDLSVPSVVASLDGIVANAAVRAFDRAVTGAQRGDPIALGVAGDPAVVFRGYMDRATLLDGMVGAATAAVRHEAQRLASAQRRAFVAWAAFASLVAVASLAVAIAVARSISKPLRELAEYAQAVNEGRLDSDPACGANRGPPETRVAFRVFTDLVANLQLLDAKANALATCAFDDPVLSRALPGRLGRSLESSVAVLSGSILERDRLQTHLAYQATHDALTGIANRAAAVVGMQDAMHRSARSGDVMALLFVDLNDFKLVNDRHGHEAGDEVLRQTATRMTACVRPGDVVARLGGDEFVVVAEGVKSVDGAMDLARRLVDTVSQPIDLKAVSVTVAPGGQVLVTVGAAIGIAMTLDGPEDPLQLLGRADAAMYRAKHKDRSSIEMFDAALQRHMVEREDVERALAQAIADPTGGGLLLQYQPLFAVSTGAIAGIEALVRWDRPGHGLLPPDDFVPVAEASSLIIDLDLWVLAEAGRRLVSWSGDPELAAIPLAVNISGRHLRSGHLAANLAAMLADTHVAPNRLTIEITETVLLDDLAAAAAELDAVRALGIRVALDDFGTGYTSLAHLQHLPIDVIKIDRSFISQLNVARGLSLVRMVIDLGHAIDVSIIAEGVETNQELEALRALGADLLQGYLLSEPLDASVLETRVHHQASGRGGIRTLMPEGGRV